MKPAPLQDRAGRDRVLEEEDVATGIGRMMPMKINASAVNQDGARGREIDELAKAIQHQRDEMAKLRPNDPAWTACFAQLNALLSERNRLKDS